MKVILPHVKELSKIRRILKKLLEYSLVACLSVVWRISKKIYVPDFPYPFTIAKSQVNVYSSFYKRAEFIGPIIDINLNALSNKREDVAFRRSFDLNELPLIFLGLSGTPKEKKAITEKFREIFQSFPKTFQFFVTIGRRNFKPIIRENVKIYGWIETRTPIYRICDIVIHRGGHNTTSECLYFGKPMIIIPTPSHPEKIDNANSVRRLGLSLVISQSHVSKKSLLKAINTILTTPSFGNMAKAIRKQALKFNAVKTMVEHIFMLYNKR